MKKIKLAVFFDESMQDAAGQNTPTEKGGIKYYNGGINGSFAELGITGCGGRQTAELLHGSGPL